MIAHKFLWLLNIYILLIIWKLSFSINFEATLPCKSRVEILKLSIDECSVKPGKY